jgi:hypothetical protein
MKSMAGPLCAGLLAVLAGVLVWTGFFKVRSAAAQYPAPPAYSCCTRAVKCALPAPQLPGQPCICMTPWGPIGGYSCF